MDQVEDSVVGSNPFAVVLANKILTQEGLRTATQADIEKALKLKILSLRRSYANTGLVLRNEHCYISDLARDLLEQLRERNSEVRYPALINLTDITLRVDPDSDYGLTFKLKDEATLIYAPVLNQSGVFNSSDIDDSTGLPKQTRRKKDYEPEEEGRKLHPSASFGLTRA